jgi:hypothetical protein
MYDIKNLLKNANTTDENILPESLLKDLIEDEEKSNSSSCSSALSNEIKDDKKYIYKDFYSDNKFFEAKTKSTIGDKTTSRAYKNDQERNFNEIESESPISISEFKKQENHIAQNNSNANAPSSRNFVFNQTLNSSNCNEKYIDNNKLTHPLQRARIINEEMHEFNFNFFNNNNYNNNLSNFYNNNNDIIKDSNNDKYFNTNNNNHFYNKYYPTNFRSNYNPNYNVNNNNNFNNDLRNFSNNNNNDNNNMHMINYNNHHFIDDPRNLNSQMIQNNHIFNQKGKNF